MVTFISPYLHQLVITTTGHVDEKQTIVLLSCHQITILHKLRIMKHPKANYDDRTVIRGLLCKQIRNWMMYDTLDCNGEVDI